MSAFLFRYHGVDDVEPLTSPSFADVDALHPFFLEVEWMADTEISTGYGDGSFRPSAAVTRQAMSAFLYRLDHLRCRCGRG
jgi:hypothetical protein